VTDKGGRGERGGAAAPAHLLPVGGTGVEFAEPAG
jgi:hypothetical protein